MMVPTHRDIHSSPPSIAFPAAIPSFPASAVACLHCCHHSISLEPSPLITTYTNTLIVSKYASPTTFPAIAFELRHQSRQPMLPEYSSSEL
ncbi:hypothetical protein EJB05_49281, partial [Eragrostis curvula]